MVCVKEQASVLVLNSDYKGFNGKSIDIDFCEIENFDYTACTGALGFSNGTDTLVITESVVTDNGDGTWKVQFDIDQLDTASLPAGRYDWQVEISQNGEEIIVGRSVTQRDQIVWVEKIT